MPMAVSKPVNPNTSVTKPAASPIPVGMDFSRIVKYASLASIAPFDNLSANAVPIL